MSTTAILPETAPEFLTYREFAKLLRITPQTLRAWLRRPPAGFPRPIRVNARVIRFATAEVRRWLQSAGDTDPGN